jgi:hypothetical protein
MTWNWEKWADLFIGGLIALVLFVVIYEGVLGWFLQKPIGGIVTLVVVGILGYMYFSK